MLKDAGFHNPDINMKVYMEVRQMSQSFIDDFLGLYINPRNRFMNSLIIGPGLPGGMMGSLMADLENNAKSLNKWLDKNGKDNISQEELLLKLFDEVKYIWPMLGYPPLVTPFSQYVKNLALMNVMQMTKGKARWSMIDENTWGMLLGKSGKLLGPVDAKILNLANTQSREFFTGNPQELYPDVLDNFRAKMKEKDWDQGEDNEELLKYAMHPPQYEDFKSGKAKEKFLEEIAKRRIDQANLSSNTLSTDQLPTKISVSVNGKTYDVEVDYDTIDSSTKAETPKIAHSEINLPVDAQGTFITVPVEGKFFLTKETRETPVKVGDKVKPGDTLAYVEAMKVINAIKSAKSGTVTEILVMDGQDIEEDDYLIKLV